MAQILYRGSFGYDLPIHLGRDLTGSDDLLVVITKPSGNTIERALDASAIVDAGAGSIAFPVQEGDLSETELHHLQVIDRSNGKRVYSEVVTFVVAPGLA